jgi:16S rRNA (guanine966-N2)-methyltransferase
MRVITGSARGASLKAPEGLDTRPTGEKVKEAVFSMLQFELEGRRVLDLFAGSGQLGIEALSRGAASAVFVDSGRAALDAVKQNVEHVRFTDRARIINSDCVTYLASLAARGESFDIVFIDPPYGKGLAEKALGLAAAHVSPAARWSARPRRRTPCRAARAVWRSRSTGATARPR